MKTLEIFIANIALFLSIASPVFKMLQGIIKEIQSQQKTAQQQKQSDNIERRLDTLESEFSLSDRLSHCLEENDRLRKTVVDLGGEPFS